MTDTTTTDQPVDPALIAVVDTYLAGLNEADGARRAELVRTAWAEEGMFWDPLAEAVGHEQIAGLADAVQQMFPGARFARTSGVDAHHGFVRFGWSLQGADGAAIVEGVDVGLVGDDGRLTRVVGFFGDLAPMG
jgi:SnoaL-like domain